MAAERGQAGDDMVAGRDVIHVGTDRFHDTSGFVTQHDGQAVLVKTLDEVQIAMADTGSRSPDEDLARAAFVDLDIFDHKRLAHFVLHGGFHEISP